MNQDFNDNLNQNNMNINSNSVMLNNQSSNSSNEKLNNNYKQLLNSNNDDNIINHKKPNSNWVIMGIVGIVIIVIIAVIAFVANGNSNKTNKDLTSDSGNIIDTENSSDVKENAKLLVIDKFDFSKVKNFNSNEKLLINNISVPLNYEDIAKVSNYANVKLYHAYGSPKEKTTWDKALNSNIKTNDGKNYLWFDENEQGKPQYWSNIKILPSGTFGEALKNNRFILKINYIDLIGDIEINYNEDKNTIILETIFNKLGKPTHIWYYPSLLNEYGNESISSYHLIYDAEIYTLEIVVFDFPEYETVSGLDFYYIGVNHEEYLNKYFDITDGYISLPFDEFLKTRK